MKNFYEIGEGVIFNNDTIVSDGIIKLYKIGEHVYVSVNSIGVIKRDEKHLIIGTISDYDKISIGEHRFRELTDNLIDKEPIIIKQQFYKDQNLSTVGVIQIIEFDTPTGVRRLMCTSAALDIKPGVVGEKVLTI